MSSSSDADPFVDDVVDREPDGERVGDLDGEIDLDREVDIDTDMDIDTDLDIDTDMDTDPGIDIDLDDPTADHPRSEGSSGSGEADDAGDGLVLEELAVTAPGADGRLTVSARRPSRSVVGRTRRSLASLIAGPTRTTPLADIDPIRRHRLEYREPSIWIWRRIVGTAFAFIVVTVAWYLLKIPDGLVSDATLPSQSQVASAFNELRADGLAEAKLVDHAAASVARLVIGALVGLGLGAVFGLAIGSAPLARTVVDPITSLLGMIPAVAVGPLIVLWFGAGEAGIVTAVTATVTWSATDSVAVARLRDMRALRPDVAHEITVGVRRAVQAGWAAVLAMETLLAPIGLGPMLWSAQRRADVLVAGVYVVGLIGLVIDLIPRTIEYLLVNGAPADRRAVRARHPAGRADRHGSPRSLGT